jgi:voltage-gated potassium channel
MIFRKKIRALLLKELLSPVLALILILLTGFAGLMFFEHLPPLQAIYLLVITLGTVGFGDVVPVTNEGKIFIILLLLSALTVGLYAIGKITTFFAEGELSTLLKQRKMNKELEKMNDHYIVCGYGKTGKRILEDLLSKGLEVVMIENNADKNEKLREFHNNNFIHIEADPANDEVLLQAGIQRAKILISVLPTDAENLFVVLSAKDLNKQVKVISRIDEPSSEAKFRRAGADFIVSPIEIATDHIISIATTSADFYSFVEFAGVNQEFNEFKFGLVEIKPGSDLINKTYREANIPNRTNLVVIGYYSANSELHVNPKAENVIRDGDRLLVFGTNEQIASLKKIAKD